MAAGGELPEPRFLFPCLDDATGTTPVDPSYYFQDAWGFEKIVQAGPDRHVDVGSHHKFVSLLSKVVQTTMVDLRPLPVTLDSLKFEAAELKRIVQPGGDLYISVPVDDRNRIYFNAHRAFCEPYLEQLFAPLEIVERRYIFGNDFTTQLRPGFGTGCYHLRRPDGRRDTPA